MDRINHFTENPTRQFPVYTYLKFNEIFKAHTVFKIISVFFTRYVPTIGNFAHYPQIRLSTPANPAANWVFTELFVSLIRF